MNKTEAAIEFEHYETDPWAAAAILKVEELIGDVLDPCTGSGILADAVKRIGRKVDAMDIHNWRYPGTIIENYLGGTWTPGCTIFMNPPFSLATEFVEHSLVNNNAAKVICFQRLAWYESRERAAFFNFYPPDRIWLCGDRATCWRHDLTAEQRRINPKTGKKRTGSTTPHAWFIFERGSKTQHTTIDKIWKDKSHGKRS